MSRSPWDVYDQFIWENLYGCTRCGRIFHHFDEMREHCKNEICEPVDNEEIQWLPPEK